MNHSHELDAEFITVHMACLNEVRATSLPGQRLKVKCPHCNMLFDLQDALEMRELVIMTPAALQNKRLDKRIDALFASHTDSKMSRKREAKDMIDRRKLNIEASLVIDRWLEAINEGFSYLPQTALDSLRDQIELTLEDVWKQGYESGTNQPPPPIPHADN